MKHVAVIGGGPAGLAAAEVIGEAGLGVTVYESKPSLGRKFLMAGKSGLNLTNATPMDQVTAQYQEAAAWLAPALAGFDNEAIVGWANDLGQDMFVGTTNRVFPRAMKASPLLRAWLARLDGMGVARRTR
ncbi:MAG: NAD(P)/FAD-dependent oxidoreductase, partial [Pseudomonadota bacterium]